MSCLIRPRLAVVYLAATTGRNMRGSRSLVELKESRKTIIQHQVEVTRKALPNAEIVLVTGCEADKVAGKLPPGVRLVENEAFAETGSARSALLGVRATTASRILILHGDLVFREDFLTLPKKGSAVLLEGEPSTHIDSVGVNVSGEHAIYLGYGCSTRWLGGVLLEGYELTTFRREASQPISRKLLVHEIINKTIDVGGLFKALAYGGPVYDVDEPSILRKIRL